MNPRNYVRLMLTAAVCATVTTVFAQNPPPPPAGAAAPQQQPQPGRGGAQTQGYSIPIPQACTPEQIAAANQPPDPAAAGRGGRGGGRGGGGTPCHMPDKREGLKAGLYDAGEAAMNLKLVAAMKQPQGMVDPNGGGGLNYANSDLAFGLNGRIVLQGNFHGLMFYNIEDPTKPSLQSIVTCPGGQGDTSIYGHLAFMSVEGYGRIDCGSQPAPPRPTATPGAAGAGAPGGGRGGPAPPDPDKMFGVRIFDITDPRAPKQVAAVQTCRGSHTHSIVLDPKDRDNIYIYVSGTAGIRSAEEKAGCISDPNDPKTSTYGIDVIKVPLAHPEQSAVVNHAYIFMDANTGELASIHGRRQGTGEPNANPTSGCHDVTSYPGAPGGGLLGGACSGNGLLLDVRDPVHPKRLDDVADAAFSFWHSATFNNDGTKLLFSDEWGGGTAPRCRATDPPMWGGDAVFDILGTGDGRHLRFGGYYKMPSWQTDQENCVAHNGSLIPVPGRDIMSQAFYQGGATVFDFTDSANIKEIAYFDRGPIDAQRPVTGGYWSVYYYNGYLYGSEIARGLDIFQLTPSEFLSQNEIDAAKLAVRDGCGNAGDLNVQCQPHYSWPASFVVARAFVDQLERSKGLAADRISAVRDALANAEKATGGARRTALTALVTSLNADTVPANSKKIKMLQDAIKELAK